MIKRLTQWLAAAVTAAATLVACGGGGGSSLYGDGGTPPPSTGPTAADLTLQLDSNSITNSAGESVVATATAVDASRNALAGIPVQISVDSNAVATVSGSTTDTQGRVTAQVGIGADRSNRVVTVTATSGTLTRTATFSVTGANLTAVPVPAVIAPGANGQIQFRLVDSNSIGIGGVPILVAGPGGVETSATTGASGDYVLNYVAPTTSATGSLEFRAQAGGDEVIQAVQLNAGASTIPPAPAGSVRSASVSANPNVVAVNQPGGSVNRSEIRAIFIGDNNAPIGNVRVRFDLAANTNSADGTFLAGNSIVYSNTNGVATTSYVPGTRSSPSDGVTVRACWDYADFAVGSCPNSTTATLTVSAEALSVSIGSDATVGIGASGLTYTKRFVIQVNDASGQAVSDVLVTPSLDLLRYYKGVWAVSGIRWVQFVNATCDNEDLNRNGVNEVFSDGTVEDANGSLNFTPGRPALEPRRADVTLVIEGSNRTNASGQVVMRIEYPQSVASWVHYNLVVSAAGVAGTEGLANFAGDLPFLAAEVNDIQTDVPFEESPYGVETSTSELRINPGNTTQRGILCLNPR